MGQTSEGGAIHPQDAKEGEVLIRIAGERANGWLRGKEQQREIKVGS